MIKVHGGVSWALIIERFGEKTHTASVKLDVVTELQKYK